MAGEGGSLDIMALVGAAVSAIAMLVAKQEPKPEDRDAADKVAWLEAENRYLRRVLRENGIDAP